MTEHYVLSFTGLSLGLDATLTVAEVFLKQGDWEKTKALIKETNLLQSRTLSSFQREYQEVEPRLQTLSRTQMQFLVEEANLIEQKQFLWYMVCKRYEFIRDFAIEVLNQRYQYLYNSLEEYDFIVFFNEKADWHDELRNLKESTQTKIRTVLFRMLREADLLSADGLIIPCVLSPAVINQIMVDAPLSLSIYPANIQLNEEEQNGTA
jgi:hypothetical protein